MNNDLISREALKKEIQKELDKADLSEYEACICVTSIYDRVIDNAPTLIWCSETPDGLPLMDMRERPKGEWEDSHIYSCGKILKGRNDVIEHKCSVCKRWSIKWDGTIPDNFCSHCGADMRGEEK